MQQPPDDLSITDDLTLVGLARAGDRLSFGLLYLRHHAAAWRMACVTSRFSPDAELAVIEGFTRVFSALPDESDEFEAEGVTFRPYVLACVRQSALDRAQAAGRSESASRTRAKGRPEPGSGGGARRRSAGAPPPSPPPPAVLAGLTVDGEVRLSGFEHHVARGALAALPELSRSALWLADVEAMTPSEAAAILGRPADELSTLSAAAREEINAVQQAALDRQEVRAECRFAAERLAAYEDGTLDPAEGLGVRAHLAGCLTCRMRRGELANTPAALAAAVPAAPLLGGEAQHHWLRAMPHVRPAERLMPPALAAGGAVPRESLARRTATQLGTVAGAAAIVPGAIRRAGRAAARPWQGGTIDLTTRSPRPPIAGSPPSGSAPSGSTVAGSPVASPTVASPTVASPTVASPTVASPTVASPTVASPTVPGSTVAGPTVASPTVASPSGPGRTVPVPSGSPGWTDSPGAIGTPVPPLPPAWTIPPARAPQQPRRDRRRLVPAGVPQLAGRAKRGVWRALPAMALAVAWVMVMMSLPRLMAPSTAPGPQGLALPAVQAYVPDFAPGAVTRPATAPPAGRPASAAAAAGAGAGAGQFAAPAGDPLAPAGPQDAKADLGEQASIALVAAGSGPAAANRSGGAQARAGRRPTPAPVGLPVVPAVTAAAATAPVVNLIPNVVTTPSLDTPISPQLISENLDATAPAPAKPAPAKPAPAKPAPAKPVASKPNSNAAQPTAADKADARAEAKAEARAKGKAAAQNAKAKADAERAKAKAAAEKARAKAQAARDKVKTQAGKARPDKTDGFDRRQPVKDGKSRTENAQRPSTVIPDKARDRADRPVLARSVPRPRIISA